MNAAKQVEETTWDTDEVLRYLDNTDQFFNEAERLCVRSIHCAVPELKELATMYLPQTGNVTQEVDIENVDWDYIYEYLTED